MIKADTPAIITTYSSNRIVRGGDTNGGGEVNGGPGGHKIGFRVVRTANGR